MKDLDQLQISRPILIDVQEPERLGPLAAAALNRVGPEATPRESLFRSLYKTVLNRLLQARLNGDIATEGRARDEHAPGEILTECSFPYYARIGSIDRS